MKTYFVTHPQVEVTALVHAPTVDKARTTYLDYLERSAQLDRGERQAARRTLIASRVKDEVPADVTLDYSGVAEVPKVFSLPTEMEPPAVVDIPTEIESPEVTNVPMSIWPGKPRGFSPIQNVALGIREV